MAIDTAKLIKSSAKQLSSKTAWFDYKAGIRFQLAFIPRSQIREMLDACTVFKFDSKSGVREPSVDNAKFLAMLCRRAIKSWEKVTPTSLSNVCPIDLSELSEEQLTSELPFDMNTVLAIAEEGYDFDTFVKEICTEASYFSPSFVDELKNSESSQSGS